MIVGGRQFNQRKIDIEQAMKGELSETIREHFVVVNGTPYPPKQVLARATDWDRSSFTTMEAQRVLTKLGFRCQRAVRNRDGILAWFDENENSLAATDVQEGETHSASSALTDSDRLAAVEAALLSAHVAIAGLASRVEALEKAV